MTEIVLDLPKPPSVNSIWRSNRGRVHRSAKYVKWLKAADALLLTQSSWRGKVIPCRFHATLILNEGMMRVNADGDNLLKCPLDFCKRIGLIRDDSIKFARRWLIELGDDTNAPAGARLILRSVE